MRFPAFLLRQHPAQEYLRIGLLISVLIHASLLALRLHTPSTAEAFVRPLEITLVNTESNEAPVKPQVLAQAHLAGGGEHDEGRSSSPLPRTALDSTDEVVLAELRQRQQQLEDRQQALIVQLQSIEHVTPARSEHEYLEDAATVGTDLREQDSIILSARVAALKERVQHYNSRPRVAFIGPSAQQDAFAHYLETWRTRIEQLGTEHYPEEARGTLYGSLQLTVYIQRDGSLVRVEIDRPSEHAILNLAAQRIVQLAAPFAPLPAEVSKDIDILAITRTWHFQNQEVQTQ